MGDTIAPVLYDSLKEQQEAAKDADDHIKDALKNDKTTKALQPLIEPIVESARASLRREIEDVERMLKNLGVEGPDFHGNQYVQIETDPSKMSVDEKHAAALKLKNEGKTYAQIAQKLGYTPHSAKYAVGAGQKKADVKAAEDAKVEAEAKAKAAAEATAHLPPEVAATWVAAAAQAAADAKAKADEEAAKPTGVHPTEVIDHTTMTTAEKQDMAHQLRQSGASLAEIGAKLGYTSAGARYAMQAGAKRAGVAPPTGAGKPTGGPKPAAVKPPKEYTLASTSRLINKAQREAAEKTLGRKPSGKNDRARALKINAGRVIADNMKSSTSEMLDVVKCKADIREVDAAGVSTFTTNSVAIKDLMNDPTVRMTVRDGVINAYRFPSAEIAAAATEITTGPNDYSRSFKLATPEEIDKAARDLVLRDLIHQWAISSNDKNPKTLAIQRLAAEEFGIKRSAEWKDESGDLREKADKEIAANGAVYRDFIQAQHKATQDTLASIGMKPNDTITLYRGIKDIKAVKDAPRGTKIDFEQRPLSSFSYRPRIAKRFASSYTGGVMEATAKVSDVFGMVGFGYGCDKEAEVVLKASEDTTLTKVDVSYDGKTVLKASAGPMPADFDLFITLDDDDTNADWVKSTWDLPDVNDLTSLIVTMGVDPSDANACRAKLTNLMSLPSWKPAPKTIKDQAADFLKTGVMPPLPSAAAKSLDPLTASIYFATRKRLLDETVQIQAMLKEWDESAHPRGADGRFGSGDGESSADPTSLDYANLHKVTESAEQPESQFGFEWPPPAVKGLNDDEFKRSRQRLIEAMAKAKEPVWSEQVVVQRQKALAEHYAPLMGKAIYAGLSGIPAAIKQAQAKYAAATKATGNASGAGQPAPATTAATQAVSNTVKVNQSQAEQILRYLYGDSYLAGAQAAGAQIGDGATMIPSVSKYVGDIDWDAWEPGDAHVASYLADGGLSDLLDRSGIDIKSLIGDSYQSALDRLGNTMADGIASGLNVDQIASSIEDQVSANAYMIANTETARATSAATMDTYDENDVEKFNWLAEDDACQTCRDNADDGPYNVGSQGTDDSDAPEQPEHPNCRCCYLPVITVDGENVAPTSDEGDQSSGGDSGITVDGENVAPTSDEGDQSSGGDSGLDQEPPV